VIENSDPPFWRFGLQGDIFMKKNAQAKDEGKRRILGRVLAKEFSSKELKEAMGGLEEAALDGSTTCCCDCTCCDC